MSPNAAAFAQYADIPVSHYTGVPEISIPLYDIVIDDFTLPISLSYHSSGIKVAQEATWVGLGWSLNVGSSISRVVKHIDDFMEAGELQENHLYYAGYYKAPDITYDTRNQYDSFSGIYTTEGKELARLRYDPEPDIFYYTLLGMSGKFLIDKSRGAVLFNRAHNLKIEVIENPHRKFHFEVTDTDGNQYFYETKEWTYQYEAMGHLNKNVHNANTVYDSREDTFIEWIPVADGEGLTMEPGPDRPFEYVSNWLLSKIVTKNNKEIVFTYEKEEQSLPTQESCVNYNEEDGTGGVHYYKSKVIIKGFRLARITWDHGHIEFPSSVRFDLKESVNPELSPRKLDGIDIYSNQTLLKRFRFSQSYFNGDYTGNYEYVFKRLRLDGVVELSASDLPLNKGHRFSYMAGSMPPKNSKDTDYWGYANGKTYGAEYYIGIFHGYGSMTQRFNGANKSANVNYARIGMLKGITYPTGGTASFTYELNTGGEEFFYEATPQEDTSQAIVGGYISSANPSIQEETPSPAHDLKTLNIQVRSRITISGFMEHYRNCDADPAYHYENLSNPIAELRQVSPTQRTIHKYPMPPLYEGEEGCYHYPVERSYELLPGIYEFEAYTPPKDVCCEWNLDVENLEPLPIVNDGDGSTASIPPGTAGLRIKEIRTDATVRSFSYPTGTVIVTPALYFYTNRGFLYRSYIAQVSESRRPLSSFGHGNFVGYDWVRESVSDGTDTSSTKYYFHNDMEELLDEWYPTGPLYIQYKNGLAKKVEQYANNTLVKSTEYDYRVTYAQLVFGILDPEKNRKYSFVYTYRIEWPMKSHENTTTFTSTGEFTERKEYAYNGRDLLWKLTTLGDGIEREEEYKYPFDFTDYTNSLMVERNMIGTPVESVVRWSGNIMSGTRTTHKEENGMILPLSVYTLDTSHSLDYDSEKETRYRPKLYFDRYTPHGRPAEVRDNGQSICYLWSYGGMYPIAEFRNVQYQSLVNVLGGEIAINALESKAIPSEADWSLLNTLRHHQTLREASITIYKYVPMVGLSEVTNPRGVTTYYSYDAFGRLTETYVKDGNGVKSILEVKEYTYTNK
jgi:YD repeat-containing protein